MNILKNFFINIFIVPFLHAQQFTVSSNQSLPKVHASSLKHAENMVSMEELNEAAILHNLRQRFDEDIIYTYISSILVSVNPFKVLPIYSAAVMGQYRKALAARQPIAPHVYALADNAYKALSMDGKNQVRSAVLRSL